MGAMGDSQLQHGIAHAWDPSWHWELIVANACTEGNESHIDVVAARELSYQVLAGILTALPSESTGEHLANSSWHRRPPHCCCILLHDNLLWMVPSPKQHDSLRETRVHINKFSPTLPWSTFAMISYSEWWDTLVRSLCVFINPFSAIFLCKSVKSFSSSSVGTVRSYLLRGACPATWISFPSWRS